MKLSLGKCSILLSQRKRQNEIEYCTLNQENAIYLLATDKILLSFVSLRLWYKYINKFPPTTCPFLLICEGSKKKSNKCAIVNIYRTL